MRGAWKPFVAWGAFGLVLGVALAIADRGRAIAPWMLLVGVGSAWLFTIVFMLVASARATEFLRGLRDAGEPVTIERDAWTWGGARRVAARGATGEWLLDSTGGRTARLDVRAPGAHAPARVWGSPRKAGRDAARAIAAGERWSPSLADTALGRLARPLHVRPAYRPRLALALAAGSFALAVLVGAASPPRSFLVLVGLAAGAGWFVVIIGAGTLAVTRGRDAWLAIGAAAGAAFVALAYAAGLALHHADITAPLLSLALAAVAAAAGWLARASRGAGAAAAIALAGAAWWLPPFYFAVTGAMALLALLTAAARRPTAGPRSP